LDNGLTWARQAADRRVRTACGLLHSKPDTTDRAAWGLALAQAWALKGDTAGTRAYADSRRMAYERVVATSPRNDEGFGLLALCLA
jgi:hypothetical protein